MALLFGFLLCSLPLPPPSTVVSTGIAPHAQSLRRLKANSRAEWQPEDSESAAVWYRVVVSFSPPEKNPEKKVIWTGVVRRTSQNGQIPSVIPLDPSEVIRRSLSSSAGAKGCFNRFVLLWLFASASLVSFCDKFIHPPG
uniref:Putative secreted protein n=1 Tax=Anopheles marajoara TaxID=58244 RepID=A0A2M4C6M3_9DIPT